MVLFSAIAIALYGYDQGMMSLVNTNRSYLRTMAIPADSPLVGVIVSVYYLGCVIGAVAASSLADRKGRKISITACLIMSIIGNILMFIPGIYPWDSDSSWSGSSRVFMLAGRVILGIGIGGIDAVIPIYSSELSKDNARGSALAVEFQGNIGGLLLAFVLNLVLTRTLGKDSNWAWRIPIIFMQVFPIVLLSIIRGLPESPRWFVSKERLDDASNVLIRLYGEALAADKLEELHKAQQEETAERIKYYDMIWPTGSQFHPTMITVMGQINQALTGYGAVSVYGVQIFGLLGLAVRGAEWVTLGNYCFYFCMMTVGWMTIDVLGRRWLMIIGSVILAGCFALLAFFGGATVNIFHKPNLWVEIIGCATLYGSTATFGICWLTTVWLIPTEIYPNSARAKGSSISVIVWGIANFAVTLLTPIGFNNLKYSLFIVFAVTNAIAGLFTWLFSPETGGRSFEANQEFFISARDEGSWMVKKVDGGKFMTMPPKEEDPENANVESVKGENVQGELSETMPLLGESIDSE
ncbi:general substrate transporter [Jackrogersella minutella]|nr:general substrate transporter [Jackrogersella minutella]